MSGSYMDVIREALTNDRAAMREFPTRVGNSDARREFPTRVGTVMYDCTIYSRGPHLRTG